MNCAQSMKVILIIVFFTLGFSRTSVVQGQAPNEWLKVLRAGRINKEFIFDNPKDGVADKAWLKYLGVVSSKKGARYKVLSFISVHGISFRGTTKVLIFDTDNKYLGCYFLGMTCEAPDSIRNNAIVFTGKKECNCDPGRETLLNFKNGLPEKFFLPCRGEMGDLYYFQ